MTRLLLLLAALVTTAALPAPPRATALVAVDSARVVGTLPEGFLGLSFEAAALSNQSLDPDEGNLARLLSTLAPTGHLRFGGTLVDTQTWWRMPGQPKPDWARYVIERANIDALALLARRTGWRVELGINLRHFDAATAADEARYAAAALGPNLVGFACGNEIDLFEGGRDWSAQRPAWEHCADIVSRYGPLLGGEEADGLRPAMLATEAKRLSLATSHFYGQYENCDGPQGHRPFTIDDLLSRATASRAADRLRREVALARAAGLPFRVSESNSAACLKQSNIGTVFAAALWSVDYQLLAASLGVTGSNMHVPWEGWRLCSVPVTYAALCGRTAGDVAGRRLRANPLYYGMLVVGSVRPGKFVLTSVRSANNITAYAVRSKGGAMQIVIIDKTDPGRGLVAVTIRGVASREVATTRTLMAPLLLSGGDAVTFAGATVADDGGFALRRLGRVRAGPRGYQLMVPAGSATIVTIPGAKAGRG